MEATIKEQILQAYQSGQDPDGMEDAVRLTAAWLNSRSEADLLRSGRALYGATADDGAVLLHMEVITAGLEAMAEVLKTVKALAVTPGHAPSGWRRLCQEWRQGRSRSFCGCGQRAGPAWDCAGGLR